MGYVWVNIYIYIYILVEKLSERYQYVFFARFQYVFSSMCYRLFIVFVRVFLLLVISCFCLSRLLFVALCNPSHETAICSRVFTFVFTFVYCFLPCCFRMFSRCFFCPKTKKELLDTPKTKTIENHLSCFRTVSRRRRRHLRHTLFRGHPVTVLLKRRGVASNQ